VSVDTRRFEHLSFIKLHLRVCNRTDGLGLWTYLGRMQLEGAARAVLEVLITERSPTKWEWRVCDCQGTTIMGGFERTRPAAKYRGNRALFLLLSTAWRHFPRSGDGVVGRPRR
jgi:hypothetical protein